MPAGTELWARVEATLPRVPRAQYEPPYVADTDSVDVRYVSLSTVNQSPPKKVWATIQDTDIIQHYQENATAR